MAESKEGTPKEWKPEPAETFLAEFNSGMAVKVPEAMTRLGFSFRRGTPDVKGGNKVTFEGERDDGTKVTIVFDKGEKYKSPKEWADEQAAE
ncbi:hypothetical protein KJ766_03855 [Patescibacteria group bacterium]|nr:hypothetical protein [Patescibacteria group bacterium]